MKKYYLIGEKLSHSYSVDIHSLFGLNYELKELSAEEVGDFLQKKDFDGLNVTIPYKKTVIPYLDEVNEIAKNIGAVNTIVNENGKLKGYNTDYFGLKYALSFAGIEIKDKRVAVLGSGGASLTAQKLAEDLGAAEISVVSRNGELNYANVYEKIDPQVIINATPVGMFPNENGKPIELNKFKNLGDVFDCVYNPYRTRLVLNAEKLGIRAVGGLKMLAAQGVYSEFLWGETELKKENIELAYKNLFGKEVNIALIGMPGAGKTCLGKLVAEKLKKPFYDTDELCEKLSGLTPEETIERYGEKKFREIENMATDRVSRVRGAVIATGGGTVLNEENILKLRSSSVVVYIERDLGKLSLKQRPLSKSTPISRLFEQREGHYLAASDIKIKNDGEKDEAAEKIIGSVFKI